MPTYDPNQIGAVQDYYRRYLGREAGADDPNTWLSGGYGYGSDLGSIENAIKGSDEAQSYAKRIAPPSAPAPSAPPTSGTNPPAPPVSYAPSTPSAPSGGADQIAQWYQQYLGRAANPDDSQKWLSGGYGYGTDLPTIQRAIQGSPEAQAYASRGQGGSSGDPTYDAIAANYRSLGATPGGAGSGPTDIAYFLQKINQTGGLTEQNKAYWFGPNGRIAKEIRGEVPPEGASGGPAGYGGSPYGGTGIFDDPATAGFEKLLNDMITRFQTPATPPGYQAAIDQMNAYLAKLNGPAYTPAQMELQQTQALDPLQQSHDAERQKMILRLGQQGISPSSGIFEKALEDLDRQFSQARTTTQADFANKAIGIDRDNAARAAALAPQVSNFQQGMTSWQDQRDLQAEQLAALIPAMAQSRLAQAQGGIQQFNPASLFSLINGIQQQDSERGSAYGSQMMQLLAQLFGL